MKRSAKVIEEIQDLLLGVGNQATGRNHIPESIREINILLIKNGYKKLDDSDFLELVKQCIQSLTYDDEVSQNKIAEVIQALAMLSPAQSHLILNYLTEVFTAEKIPSLTEEYSTVFQLVRGTWSSGERSINFIQGVLLGIFQTSNYLDDKFPLIEEYDADLCFLLSRVILHNKTVVHLYKCSKDLSKAIKNYCDPDANKDMRLSRILTLLTCISSKLDCFKPNSCENMLGTMLLEELMAKLLNSFKIDQKVRASLAILRADVAGIVE